MKNIYFLQIEDITYIHQLAINRFGGKPGIRNHGLLESALNQPLSTFNNKYLHENIFMMAAAYAYHLIKNHPFYDGNKRTGIIAAITFLNENVYKIKINHAILYKLTIDIANSKTSKKEIAIFFKKQYDSK